MRATEQTATGEWIVPPVSYVEPLRIFCALCGRPIARRYWQAAAAGEPLPFCDPEHEEKYRTYWLPTYGNAPESCEPLQ
jgi:hypothetical protein